MKEFIFKQYVNNICNHMGLNTSELFEKSRKAEIVEARQILFYLCHEKRKMGYSEIKKYTDNVGFDQDVSNISYHVDSFKVKLEKDPDYFFILKKIDKIEY